MTEISLTAPQFEFVTAEEQFPALVAGFGAGKTHAAIARALARKLAYPNQNVAYYLPTYDLVRTMGFPRFAEVLEWAGLPYKINRAEAVIEVGSFGRIIFRTMDTPERIVAYEVADSLVDELDTLSMEKAREVWNKIIGRNRQKKPDGSLNTVGVATTPEGFRFVYERWHRNPAPGYRLIKASTMSNSKNLPSGYIDGLRSSYSTALLAAYLDGEFVNLTAGSVYPDFDRALNHTSATIQPGEPLHIGMDFNVANMAAVVNVQRNGDPHAVDELVGLRDTPAMIEVIKDRYRGHHITVYPDRSGKSRKSVNASISDLSLLQEAGFSVWRANANPAVKDRVLAMNQMIHSDGQRRLRVNSDTCPQLVMSLEQQAYDKNGEPDKASGSDHVNDAQGYYIEARYPVQSRAVHRRKLRGF